MPKGRIPFRGESVQFLNREVFRIQWCLCRHGESEGKQEIDYSVRENDCFSNVDDRIAVLCKICSLAIGT